MSQAIHIFRKDLRRLRWWLALWAALLAARVLLASTGIGASSEGFAEQIVIEQVTGALGIATLVLFGLLVARLVQDEPLVGLDWFWLTRPYDRWALLGAKLGFAALFFLVLPLMAELVVMATFGATPWEMFRSSSVFLARDARWTVGLMVFAVLTPTLVGFALGLVGTAAALSLALLGMLAVAMLRMPGEARPSDAPADATSAVLATAVFILACLAVVTYQYHRRRRGRALALAAIGVAAMVIVPSLWPWPLARARAVEPAAWATDPDRVALAVDRSAPPEISDEPPFRRRDARRRQVTLPVAVTGLPPGYRPQSAYAESRLELRDGAVIESGHVTSVAATPSGFGDEPVHHLQGVLGDDVRVLPVMSRGDTQPRAALLTATDEQLARHGSEPGQLVTTLHMLLLHSRVAGTLPLAEGAAFDRDGLHIEIVRVQRRYDGCTVLLRQWHVTSIVSPPERRHYEFVLRNVQRREAYAGSPQHRGFGASSLGALALFGFTSEAGREGFSVQHFSIDYPQRWPGGTERWTIDAEWLDGADLAVVETAPAGIITRTVALEDFRMRESSPIP